MSGKGKIKVAVLWHMHQPYYFDSDSKKFQMPWVRLHGLKDYLDMPQLAGEMENSRVTFNLVPSLLDQIELYCQGYTDRHQDLSLIPARDLDKDQKQEILSSFFSAFYPRMIKPYYRYRQLFKKMESCNGDLELAVKIFSSSELLDLQVWSNLTWIDPSLRDEEPIAYLFKKEKNYNEQDKRYLLDYQLHILQRIIPTYRNLFRDKRIDLSFSPYYHPILPLLIDTDSAREAMADIELPQYRFNFPADAEAQLRQSGEMFRQLFSREMPGIWPSEGSISDETVKLLSNMNIKWAASDQRVLYYSLVKSEMNPNQFPPHRAYIYEEAPNTTLFFRDQGLSDKIGFVYSGWDHDRAVLDFVENIKNIGNLLAGDLDNSVIPIILDGENAWEFYRNDGRDFLRQLYRSLSEDVEIEMTTFSEAAERLKPARLPKLHAGSWINHNFRVWIGHREDNAAWDLLYQARRTLVSFEANNPDYDKSKLNDAWRQLYIAEGSDWCWWYGDDHVSVFNSEFDRLFRSHLKNIYKALNLEPPMELDQAIHIDKSEISLIYPEALVTPTIDGRRTHYYEWSGAGRLDSSLSGKAMHRGDSIVRRMFFAYDYFSFYIRLDFEKNIELVGSAGSMAKIEFKNIGIKEIPLNRKRSNDDQDFRYMYDQILEFAITRTALLKDGFGKVEFCVEVNVGDKVRERWPAAGYIAVDIPERTKEIFWQV